MIRFAIRFAAVLDVLLTLGEGGYSQHVLLLTLGEGGYLQNDRSMIRFTI